MMVASQPRELVASQPTIEIIERPQVFASPAQVVAVQPYNGPIYTANEGYTSGLVPAATYAPYAENPSTLETVQQGGQDFGNDLWDNVVKPVGVGLVAPVAGAGAFIGGTALGAGAFVGSCVFGAVSFTRGVVGTIPLTVDYAIKPVTNGVDVTAHKVDNMTGSMLSSSGNRAPDKALALYDNLPARESMFSGLCGARKVVPEEPMLMDGGYYGKPVPIEQYYQTYNGGVVYPTTATNRIDPFERPLPTTTYNLPPTSGANYRLPSIDLTTSYTTGPRTVEIDKVNAFGQVVERDFVTGQGSISASLPVLPTTMAPVASSVPPSLKTVTVVR
jgi:hypothetical protein